MDPFGHLTYSALSDIGRRRSNNEDAYVAVPSRGFWCVSDGMGGGDDGEVASSATVKAAGKAVEGETPPAGTDYPIEWRAEGVARAISNASEWIYNRTREKHLKGCGATLVAVLFDPTAPSRGVALHAGDSRLYRISQAGIVQITKDHSASGVIGARDESEINPMFRGVIFRAVGIQRDVELEQTVFEIQTGDRLLLCSDGLSRMISDDAIAAASRANPTPEGAVKALIDAANAAGGADNITAVVVDVGVLPPPIPQTVPAPHPPRKTKDEASDTTDDSMSTWVGETVSGGTGTLDMTASTSTPTDGSDSFSTSLPCVREGDCCLPNAPEGKRAQTSMVGWWVAILLFILVLGVFTYLFLAKRDGSATMLENQRLKARLAELEASSKIQDKAPDQGKFVTSNPDGKDQKNGER